MIHEYAVRSGQPITRTMSAAENFLISAGKSMRALKRKLHSVQEKTCTQLHPVQCERMTTTSARSTLNYAEAMAQLAWSRRGRKSNPWLCKEVQSFVQDMDRASYQFSECDYPIGSASITNKWEQLFQWAESIAQNERDTARGL